ncbi:Uncharacterised protein [Streptococcus pneumoniae]|nr:Uncharacterised protein [Streptococcus pneumoniae]
MHYQTFSDLVNEVKDLNGKITGENAKKLGEFYSYWGNYLEPTPAFMAYLSYLPGGIAKALYQITSSLEHVFNNMFKLFGLFGYLGDQKTVIGQFFYWFQILGTSLFTLILVVSVVVGVFTKPVKYKGVIINFLLVTAVTSVLPLALTTISTAVAQDAMSIQTVSSEAPSGSQPTSSLALQPMKNNVVDLKVLIYKDFSTELFPMDDYGYIKPVQEGSTPVNNITDNPEKRDTTDFATKIDFGANYGTTNPKMLDDIMSEDKIPGIKGLFLHKLNSNNTGVESITEHRLINQLSAFESVYMRYKVNWIGMFLQYIILVVLLVSMIIKLVKSIFDILIEAMISPILGYSSLSNSKKYKELLRTIGGALAGIFFEVIIMRVTLEIFRDLPILSVSAVSKLSGGFFDGLNMWEQCLAAAFVYIGVFFAAMQGVAMIERWLGVSTGHSETAQQLLGAMMMGNAFAAGAGGVFNGGMALGQFGMDMAKKTPDALSKGSQILGNSLARTGGGIQGALNSIKDQGLMNAAKGGVSNMVDLAEWKAFEAVQNTKGAVGNVLDKLDDKAVSAQNATYNALKNDAVPGIDQFGPVDIPESPIDPGTTDAPIVDSTPSTEEIGSPIQEPPLQTEGAEPPIQDSTHPTGGTEPPIQNSTHLTGGTEPPIQNSAHPTGGTEAPIQNSSPSVVESTQPPKQPDSPQQKFQQSMSQMQYMNQQMQQAGQRMQGGRHITGAESPEEEE